MHPHRTEAGHEARDIPIRPVLFSGLILAIAAAIVISLSVGVFRLLVDQPLTSVPNPLTAGQIPPVPRIEEHPATEFQQLRQSEDRALSTYGWVNKQNGVVRLPIDRAIDLQLERGFPTRKETAKQ